ncbi:MAG: hypothetical protein QOE24_2113 [Frankiales bacterium]|nr:hypothetical protein [Frankiales bacterium]
MGRRRGGQPFGLLALVGAECQCERLGRRSALRQGECQPPGTGTHHGRPWLRDFPPRPQEIPHRHAGSDRFPCAWPNPSEAFGVDIRMKQTRALALLGTGLVLTGCASAGTTLGTAPTTPLPTAASAVSPSARAVQGSPSPSAPPLTSAAVGDGSWMGHTVTYVQLQNRGPVCTLTGYAEVRAFNAAGRRIPITVQHQTQVTRMADPWPSSCRPRTTRPSRSTRGRSMSVTGQLSRSHRSSLPPTSRRCRNEGRSWIGDVDGFPPSGGAKRDQSCSNTQAWVRANIRPNGGRSS